MREISSTLFQHIMLFLCLDLYEGGLEYEVESYKVSNADYSTAFFEQIRADSVFLLLYRNILALHIFLSERSEASI